MKAEYVHSQTHFILATFCKKQMLIFVEVGTDGDGGLKLFGGAGRLLQQLPPETVDTTSQLCPFSCRQPERFHHMLPEPPPAEFRRTFLDF